ncbi:MAG TPA: SDR family NAD(P)-dependent oxidoreductase [Kribbella sp.]|nr:SDR family NAD(P)-dependent oxidoreductase [Amycolatopsis sp.]HWD77611.1 SDR family NAD(P)-dependent oxidoreductase [Kribbella sp.]
MTRGQASVRGRVAVVTGAGRGLGRAYARLLAQRGAKVVVNDLGAAAAGGGTDTSVAEDVAAEIRNAGGDAVADGSDVSDPQAAEGIVQRAIDTFGGIDIVVNNAGILTNQRFEDATWEDFERFFRVHLGGHVNVTKAAWPHMKTQRRGRVVCTESGAGLYGLIGQATYSAAKGAVHGLMRTLALEGRDHGILVNAVAPGGFSRMHEAAIDDPQMLERTRRAMPAELVAPAVVWLASDEFTGSGQVYSAWAGRVARIGIGTGPGFVDRALTPEIIAEHVAVLGDLGDFYEPVDSLDEVSAWLEKAVPGGL